MHISQRTSALNKGRKQHVVSRLSMDLKRDFTLRVLQASSWYIPNVNEADDRNLRVFKKTGSCGRRKS